MKEFLETYWSVPIGAIVLWIYGVVHFNSPPYALSSNADEVKGSTPKEAALAQTQALAPPVFTTGRETYRKYEFQYVGVLIGIFLVVACFPALLLEVENVLQINIEVPGTVPERVLFALFGLTGLLSTFPGLRDVDKWFIANLHKKAIIPDQARFMAERLAGAEYKPTEAARTKALGSMRDTAFDRTDFASAPLVEQSWFKLSCLYYELRRLLDNKKYSLPRKIILRELSSIDREYGLRREKMISYRETGKGGVNDPVVRQDSTFGSKSGDIITSTDDMRQKLIRRNDTLVYRICLAISLLLLATEDRMNKVNSRFQTLGFEVGFSIPEVDIAALVILGMAIFFAMLVPGLIYEFVRQNWVIEIPRWYGDKVPHSVITVFLWALLASVLHAGCLWLGMYLKKRFALKKSPLDKDSPIVDLFKIGCFCYGVTYIFGVLAFMLYYGSEVLKVGLPWAFAPTTTGIFVAFYVEMNVKRKSIKWWHAVAQATITGCVALLAILVFTTKTFIPASWPTILWLFAGYGFMGSVLVGLSVGLIFPRMYAKSG